MSGAFPIDRRTLLAGLGTALAIAPAGWSKEADFVPLWPGPPPGGGGPSGFVEVTRDGAIDTIAKPGLEVFLPETPTGAAMLVVAGGGYRRIMMDLEARPMGRWLSQRGIAAFALVYRLPREDWGAGRLAPLQDAQRAIRLIRSRAARYGLDVRRLGMIGFSAGGYLTGLAATRFDESTYAPVDATDSLSARPDGAAMIYPVVTLEPPYDHTSTARQVLGRDADPALVREWSVESAVRPGDPPVFLVHASDDPTANPENSRIMARACRQAGIPVELHLPANGRHGFGLGRPGTESADWLGWYEAWLAHNGFSG